MDRAIERSVVDIPFAEAEEFFKEFLTNVVGESLELRWVFSEDVVFVHDRTFIRTAVPDDNQSRAKACYELGQNREFGVNMHCFSRMGSFLCCFIQLPKDDLDSEYMLMSKALVKYSKREPLLEARPISNGWQWRFRRWQGGRERFPHSESHMPSRYTLLPVISESED